MDGFKKSWSDQPDIVTEGKTVLSVSLSEYRVEVRRTAQGRFFITCGTLFESQTVETRHMDTVMALIQQISDGKMGAPPEGATLLDNAKETDDGATDQIDQE